MAKAKLLVVEDEPNLLLGIRDILELDNYEVMTAQNGKEALDVLYETTERPPDLIVSDIMMPHMDGIEFLEHVRNEDKWVMIPFIFLTAKGEKTDVYKGKLLGVDDYLIKPFDADDLLVAVQAKLQLAGKRTEVASSAIDKVKENILTILNHEMRTPLTLVVAYADMLKDHPIDQMDEQELIVFLREINSGADRLRRLIENFILLVEIDTGAAKETYNWRKYKIPDVDGIIHAAIEQVRESGKEFTCEVRMPEDIPAFWGDRDYLLVMFRELIDNAAKFTENGAPISIELYTTPEHVCVSVMDQGRGIKPSELETIWSKFYQTDRDHYEDQGAGSGLAIIKGLTDLHKAEVEVESKFGQGSTFTLKFNRPS